MPFEVKWSQVKYHKEIYLFLVPTLLLIGLFIYYPAASGIYHSFFRWNGADISEFIWAKNYTDLFKTPEFWQSFKVALMLGVFNVLKMSVALMVAVCIHRCVSAKIQFFYRVLFVIPMVIPGLVVVLVWRTLFFEATNGFLNKFLLSSGLFDLLCHMDNFFGWGGVFKLGSVPAWLGDPKLIVVACIVWGFPWVGSFAVLTYLAKLQGISKDVYEAAEIDGISWFSKFTKIEMPLIMGSIYILLVLMIIETIKDAGMILALAGMYGGPGGKATVPALFMLRKAFLDQQMGFACAIGIVLTIIVMILQKTLTWVMTPAQTTVSRQAKVKGVLNGILFRLPLFYLVHMFLNVWLYRAGAAWTHYTEWLKVPGATLTAWKDAAEAQLTAWTTASETQVAALKAASGSETLSFVQNFNVGFESFCQNFKAGLVSFGQNFRINLGEYCDNLLWCAACILIALALEWSFRGISNAIATAKLRYNEAHFDKDAAIKRLSNPWIRAYRFVTDSLLRGSKHAFIWGVLFFAFLPLYLMIVVSFKTNPQFYTAPASPTFPLQPGNWVEAWEMVMPSVANSVFVSTLVTGLALIFALASAYFFARQKMPMSGFIWNAILVLMMMPMIANLVPLFRLLVDLSLVNTLTALICVGTAGGQVFAIFVLRNFVQEIPRDLYEAAEIDGANHFQQLWRIVVPLSGPIMGTVGVQLFIQAWNEFIMPLVIIRDATRLPVMVQLLRMAGEYVKFWGPLMAGYAMASIPIILLFVFSMKLFVRGLTEGAVKG